MALPLPAGRFDAAVMALVIFFLPDPARGVAEMARVVRPGGLVASYAWDMAGGGFPLDPVHQALRALGREPARPPSLDASRMEALQALWEGAGLEAVETREIAVRRGFGSFEEFWYAAMSGAGLRNAVAAMTQAEVGRLRQEVRARLPPESAGRILCGARANAIKGRVPA
jgi:SAM-dependent methyltransferase